MTNPKAPYATKIRTIRKDLGYTMQEFSRLIGVATNTVSRIENGRNIPSMKTLVNIAQKVNISLSCLLSPKEM